MLPRAGHACAGALWTDLPVRPGAAAIRDVLDLDHQVVRIVEIELVRAERMRRAAAIVRTLAKPGATSQRFDCGVVAVLDWLEAAVGEDAHDAVGVEPLNGEARVVRGA